MLVVLMIFGMAVGGVGASGFRSSKGLLLCPFLGGSSGGSAGCVRACVREGFTAWAGGAVAVTAAEAVLEHPQCALLLSL